MKRDDLTVKKVNALGPGTHRASRGLYLQVTSAGTRSWVFRYMHDGAAHEMGLGPLKLVSLAKAREKVTGYLQQLLEGLDPLAERRREKDQDRLAKASTLTFRQAAEALIESQRSGWRNSKHAAQWSSTLATYVYPKLGALDVKAVDTAAVLGVLQPIWARKTETASRVRQRIEAVLDYSTAIGKRSGENPARWRGHLDHLLAKPSKVRAVQHHAALNWHELPAFMAELTQRETVDARALAFTILTAARSGEARGLTWAELDLEEGIWTVPPSRIKAGKEHRVPLPPEALALLGAPGAPGELVFESSMREGRPLSDATLAAVLRRMGRTVTVHGFRSTFRDWSGETTAHPREVIEAALAHRLKDKAEAAYARGDLFKKRRRLMQDWARYALSTPAGGKVIAMSRT